jgi:2-polyprenyl-3-methyl-5-hydroxy-6-metoxy-1,4-benzoquinol methylase
MDDPTLDPILHDQALRGLARLNRVSGVAGLLFRQLRHYAAEHPERPLRVLDIATGSGDLPIRWSQMARRRGMALEVMGLDISDQAIRNAQRQAATAGVDVEFLQWDVVRHKLPQGFDVVTCSLFLHHLDDLRIRFLLQSMVAVAGRAVVICDLERSRLNLAAIWLASHLLSRSPVVHFDATASVRAALTGAELKRLAESALERPVLVRSAPPCRYLALIDDAAELAVAPALCTG